LDLRAFAARWDAQPIFAHRTALTDPQRRLLEGERQALTPSALQVALRVLGLGAMPALWPRLPRLAVPVHLIVGGEDPKFLQLAAQASHMLPDALLTVIPGAHHDVVLTHPHAVADAMAAFGHRLNLKARA
jgi:pimeloyl-ACP methyl ester carboxylesterase